ncbi:ATP-dependent RNA helicase HrpA [Humisphaera borealis]|uniref:ATP-dependent RNA helicase HrpA n=1 Tax=Humisphaera borealis TaxID=2807512 RepID=A0A7M2X3Z3_9BACT|nr:ATP-dependent RNA helicase HrpA [Humisphaera borealis]
MLRDRPRLRSRLRAVRSESQKKTFDAARLIATVQSIGERIEDSSAEVLARRANLPKPTFPEELPVVQRREDIKKAIAENQVVVLCGETGSGKTTQLPKILLELGRGVTGMIGHTQPRRIAARSVAMRIASELKSQLGHAVGYKVRFNDQTRRETYVKLMTDGILLAEAQADRFLNAYDTIIIDEAHERSLNIDFLLGLLKTLLPRRPELKLIITSATIDPQRFATHFGEQGKPAPILEISGRTYPVEVRYRALDDDTDPDSEDLAIEDAIVQAAGELAAEGPGDMLVFLAGEREIRETAEALRKHHPAETEILPLFSRLNADEQMKVFQPHQRRRIVLATNVAETSLTVPGIRYVIDPGLARMSRYNARTKVQRLPIERISQASADQRKGRCGRVGPGVCVRLYSEEDFASRPVYTDPEILRTNLSAVILQMKAFGLGNVQDFPFIEPPDYRAVRDGYATLHELGAIDDRNELTQLGHQLARLPVDPRLGRMVLAAIHEDCLEEVLVIASALAIQDPRERPMEKAAEADTAHAPFRDPQSDFLGFLRLWDAFHDRQKHLSGSKLRKWCQASFVSYVRMREWHDVHSQLKEIVGELGLQQARRAAQQVQVRESPSEGSYRRRKRGPRVVERGR